MMARAMSPPAASEDAPREDGAYDEGRQQHEHAADEDLLDPVGVLEEEAEGLPEVEVARGRVRGRRSHGLLLSGSSPTVRGGGGGVNRRGATGGDDIIQAG